MRYLQSCVADDLKKKMVFLGGPRQCGKTTLAKSLLKLHPGSYFNWDDDVHRRQLLARQWSDDARLVVFDELHKFPRWKNWIKGIFDTRAGSTSFLVTGSARLDLYRRGGDSLLGRYHYWRLHPFGLDEKPAKMSDSEALSRLLHVGGFPEPFLDGDEREARRWRRERVERVLKDDIRDLESIKDVQTLSLFVDSLRQRVGGMVVLANIANDLQVSPATCRRWLDALERMYLVFVIRPLQKGVPRALQKPPKVYFFDTGDVIGDEGARFENFVATQLLKHCHFREDQDGHKYELCYIRDKEGREVDFAIVKDGVVTELYESKWSETGFDPALRYYAERLSPKRAIQVVGTERASFRQGLMERQSPFWFRRNPLL
ncbi:MAG: ATP-binding protein [Deltaproteobacteria bacterium]|nr:ATP-binding protein [Deltaproteobacteria bacterium]